MKQQVSPAVVAGVLAVVVILLGFAVWKSFAGPPAVDTSKIPAGYPGSTVRVRVGPGQLPPGVAPPKGAPGT